jgi:hypothetical protein
MAANAIKVLGALSEEDIHDTLFALPFRNSFRNRDFRLLLPRGLVSFAVILRRNYPILRCITYPRAFQELVPVP